MQRKTLLVLCCLISTLYAGFDLENRSAFRMPYVGLKGSASCARDEHERSSAQSIVKQDEGLLGGSGSVYSGFGGKLFNVYLGPEGEFLWGNVRYRDSNSNGGSTLSELTIGAQLRAKFGYFVAQPVLLYLQGGYNWQRMKKEHYAAGGAFEYSFRKWLGGGLCGMGSEIFVTNYLGLTLDYTFTWFKEESLDFNSVATGLAETVQDKMRQSTFSFGIFYNF